MMPRSELSDVTALTRRLVAFDTINPPGRETEAMRYCAGLLESIGFDCHLISHGEGRSSLVAQRGPEGGLVFSGHLDTVPLGRAPWTHPPHEGRIEGDQLYGRGSSDMKGGIAAFLVAAARNASKTGTGVILTAGEETGCDGARWLAEAGRLPKTGALVVGESTDNQPLAGHKGALWLKLTAKGRTAHGATPELGVNAIATLSPTLARLCAYQPETFHPQMGRATCNLGTIRAGINVNSVPDLCELTVDLRSVEGISHAELTAEIAARCDAGIGIETLLDLASVWTDPENPWFAAAARSARGITGRQDSLSCATYFTDASILKPALGDPPVMILGPGGMDQPHGTDEYVRLSRLAEAVEIYAALIASAG
ncbi:M20 family metallopeptidase [Salipiger marinus]|uniref:M20 family metallopeptidase n=1 Tax=Salipiger marinus TaxID=555512 RepID=UPI002CF10CDA|nr:M20 family metallopeptidase [Salipiger manganoxidans]MEB3419189.1 M20 family metallopeptidase [Salipiger manganoxidans]